MSTYTHCTTLVELCRFAGFVPALLSTGYHMCAAFVVIVAVVVACFCLQFLHFRGKPNRPPTPHGEISAEDQLNGAAGAGRRELRPQKQRTGRSFVRSFVRLVGRSVGRKFVRAC